MDRVTTEALKSCTKRLFALPDLALSPGYQGRAEATMRDSRTLVSFFESLFMPHARSLGVNGFSVGPPLVNTHS
jgi:hypothetical protein